MYVYGLYEMVKYTTYCNFQQCMGGVAVNKDAFNELPKDLQDIVLEAAQEANAWAQEWSTEEDLAYATKGVIDYGVTIARMPGSVEREAREKMKPLWQDWATRSGPNGPDLLKRILDWHEEWIKAN